MSNHPCRYPLPPLSAQPQLCRLTVGSHYVSGHRTTYTGLDVFPAGFKLIIEFQACLSIIGPKWSRVFFSTFSVTFPPSLSFLPPYSLYQALKKILNAVFLSPPGPRWASWNLGIFICIRCAGIHRNLGVHISKVKSVNLDQWTQEQVQVRGHTAEPNTTYVFQYHNKNWVFDSAGLQRSSNSNGWSTIKTNTFALC